MAQQGTSVNRYNGDGALVQSDRVAYTQDLASSLSKVLQINDGTHRINYIYGHERLLSDAAGSEWYATDALGSLRFTLNDDGLATSGTTYDPFGQRERGTIATFGFTGELQDANSDNVYLRARWYNPSHGAFMAQDPFGGFDTLPYSMHPYQYAYSNPGLFTDPSGRCVPGKFLLVILVVFLSLLLKQIVKLQVSWIGSQEEKLSVLSLNLLQR